MFHKPIMQKHEQDVLTVFSQWYLHMNDDVVLFLLNEEMEIMQASSSMENYFSLTDQQCIGTNFFQIVPHDIFTDKDLWTEQVVSIPKFQLYEKNTYFSLIIEKQIMDERTYYFCLLQDITEMTELKETVINQKALIESATLATGLVHEFRNPLTSLKGFLQLLQAGVTQKEAYYEVMIKEVEKLEQLSTNLLQMSKPKQEHRNIENISQLIDDVTFILQTQSHLQQIKYDICIDDDYDVYADGQQLKQVFLNLCKNSAEAMDYNGTIYFHVFHNEYTNEIVIEIKDEGTGLSDEVVKEWNQPFYTTKNNGTGLGLMICNTIISDHNGCLFMDNDQELGTVATITLPLHINNNN